MREIEVKVKAANKDAVIAILVERGVRVSAPVTHHDRVFASPIEYEADTSRPWLRIRTETKDENETHTFTLKKSVTSQLDSIEHETIIDNPGELEKIIEHINFTPYSDLTKTRQKATIGDVEICIDSIEGLGDFVEAELLVEEDVDIESITAKLWEVLTSLGFTQADQVTDGYDVMMNKKLGRE